MRKTFGLSFAALVFAAGCGEAPPPGPALGALCQKGEAGQELSVVQPAADEWVRLEAFELKTSAAGAPVEYEVWSTSGGVPIARVWSSTSDAPAVRLADGAFDVQDGALLPRKRYAARARRSTCAGEAPWSAFVPFRIDDASAELFDDSKVLDFHLDLPPDSYAAIDAEAWAPDCSLMNRTYHPGTLRFGNQSFEGVGVRVKGGCGSSRQLDGKASFKVNLEWDDPAVEGPPAARRLFDRKRFTFNNNVQDPSFLNERFAYPLYRALGVPSPRATSVRLFVNGQLYGLYTNLETLDRDFLARHFEDDDGPLYEGTYFCELRPGNVPPGEENDTRYCLTEDLQPEAPTATFAPLRELTSKLAALPEGGFYPEVQAFFEYDRFLTTWALETYLANWDGYLFTKQNNYRVYRDPDTGRWTLISTGLDQIIEAGHDALPTKSLLTTRCLAEAECAAAYRARLQEVTARLETMALSGKVAAISAQLSPFVAEDPRKEVSVEQYEAAVAKARTFLDERPVRVRTDLLP